MFESAAIALFLWVDADAWECEHGASIHRRCKSDTNISVKSETDFATAFPLGGEGGTIVPDEGG